MPEPTPVDVAEDLALLGPDGVAIASPMEPRQALDLAEILTRRAFRRMFVEEAVADEMARTHA